MWDELSSDEPLAVRLERLRADGAPDHEARMAIVSALLGRRDEANAATWRAHDAIAPREHAALSAFVALSAGDAARALAALAGGGSDLWTTIFAAEALGELGQIDAAFARLAAADETSDSARVTRAQLSLLRGDAPGALASLERLEAPGVIGARARRLRAEAWLSADAGRDERRARDELSAAVWRLVRLGAAAELGRSYLVMAEIEIALGGTRGQAASWLARAHPLLMRAGAPLDEERLRRAFRRFGRRAIDRLVDSDLERVIEGSRRSRARAIDLAGASRDLRSRREGSDTVDEELRALLSAMGDQGEELITSLEHALLDREQTGRLVDVCRELLGRQDPMQLDEELPRLVLPLGGEAAHLHRIEDARFVRVSSAGAWPKDIAPPGDEELASAVRAGVITALPSGTGRCVLVPMQVRGGARVLVVRHGQARTGARSVRDDERLAILGSVATVAYESAVAAAALREAAARDAATLEAIREGILTLDAGGRVRALNTAAAAVLGVLREDVEGLLLSTVPGLAPLADAITKGLEDEPIRLPKNDVLVRVRAYAGGSVVTISELERARQLAHRLVGSEARFTFEDLVGRDPAFLEAIADARRVALAEVPALVTGESGTGKELFAQAIHNASPRASHPFVGVNVAAIPRELLESELFGYEAGAFTGARARGHPGRFELADRGTILLDEIGDMPLEMQAKLLRVLQERTVTRLGGTRAIPVRARLIATTHRDLEEAVKDGSFRLDLFYRLRVVHLRLPALRERRGDVPVLTAHHLERLAQKSGRAALGVSPDVMRELERYAWPGNVRELANLLEGVASLLPVGETMIRHTPASVQRALASASAEPTATSASAASAPRELESLDAIERRAIEHALAVCGGNLAQTARALGVARNTLYNKLARYGVKTEPSS